MLPEPFASDPRAYGALVVILALALVAQRFMGWRRYKMLHSLRTIIFPLLDGKKGLFLVSGKGYTDDAEYLTTVDESVRGVFQTLVSEGDGSPHLLSSIKVRELPNGDKQYSAAHVVWTHTDGAQTEAYLFSSPEGGTDVYVHVEASVIYPREHLEGEQIDGDTRGVVAEALA